ncbi:2-C-methyl-D-erythritol 4-phosphate cytidylyltransferase [Candidatus Marinamargulisbacteria bacterium SCGC AG-333-B06]|nr:2-C-methyl-D-erythritol 4-phosphate cytidylyltransferase [Candidatus Marinamargulisbacteria bacterium SCGC AG-333-B06]
MTTLNIIIPAAGTSNRFKSTIPKQFHVIGGKTILEHTLMAFASIAYQECLIAVNNESRDKVEAILSRLPMSARVVMGGDTRAKSVRQAFFEAKESDITLIHDAARMCISTALIDRVIQAAKQYDAVIPTVPVTDTIKQIEEDRVIHTLTRENLVAVQTPQAFNSQVLKEAYETSFDNTITDEASLIEKAGKPVQIIKGECENIKVTYPMDLEYVKACIHQNPAILK